MCLFLKLESMFSCLNASGVSTFFSCCKRLWKNLEKLVSSGHAVESRKRRASCGTLFYYDNTVLKCIDRRILHQKPILSEIVSLIKAQFA